MRACEQGWQRVSPRRRGLTGAGGRRRGAGWALLVALLSVQPALALEGGGMGSGPCPVSAACPCTEVGPEPVASPRAGGCCSDGAEGREVGSDGPDLVAPQRCTCRPGPLPAQPSRAPLALWGDADGPSSLSRWLELGARRPAPVLHGGPGRVFAPPRDRWSDPTGGAVAPPGGFPWGAVSPVCVLLVTRGVLALLSLHATALL